MRFTKGLFLGTALGMTAAIMMNNKTKTNKSNTNTNDVTTDTNTQANDYMVNDII